VVMYEQKCLSRPGVRLSGARQAEGRQPAAVRHRSLARVSQNLSFSKGLKLGGFLFSLLFFTFSEIGLHSCAPCKLVKYSAKFIVRSQMGGKLARKKAIFGWDVRETHETLSDLTKSENENNL